jgi:hypothetical protein
MHLHFFHSWLACCSHSYCIKVHCQIHIINYIILPTISFLTITSRARDDFYMDNVRIPHSPSLTFKFIDLKSRTSAPVNIQQTMSLNIWRLHVAKEYSVTFFYNRFWLARLTLLHILLNGLRNFFLPIRLSTPDFLCWTNRKPKITHHFVKIRQPWVRDWNVKYSTNDLKNVTRKNYSLKMIVFPTIED